LVKHVKYDKMEVKFVFSAQNYPRKHKKRNSKKKFKNGILLTSAKLYL
jgi:hypothetical protein